MGVFRDPNAPAGRVVLGGVEFIDGLTGDITPGESTCELFAAVGVVEVQPEDSTPDTVEAPPEQQTPDSSQAEPPAPRKRK